MNAKQTRRFTARRPIVRALQAAIALGAAPLAVNSHAQGGYNLLLEEVIVTANRREENLQNVAISVAAFTDQFFKHVKWYRPVL